MIPPEFGYERKQTISNYGLLGIGGNPISHILVQTKKKR